MIPVEYDAVLVHDATARLILTPIRPNTPMNASSLEIQEHAPLAPLTTFRIGGAARYLVSVHKPEAIPSAIRFAQEANMPLFVLGGGSNVVVADAGVDGVVLRLCTRGIAVLEESARRVRVKVAAGEVWDGFVDHCVRQGWWGVENMSLIPGTVGALPIQNVGAYGQEASDTVEAVEAWDRDAQAFRTLSNRECGFGYRTSLFNTLAAGRYVISAVTFSLAKNGRANLEHVLVRDRVEARLPDLWSGLRRRLRHRIPRAAPLLDALRPRPAIGLLREVVVALRTDGRLPDVAATGNAGSFFKNVVLGKESFEAMVAAVSSSRGDAAAASVRSAGERFAGPAGYKIPAGVLVKLCGCESLRRGGAALHPSNPTIVINESGSATASDVLELATAILGEVQRATGVRLQIEPQAVGFAWP